MCIMRIIILKNGFTKECLILDLVFVILEPFFLIKNVDGLFNC